LFQKSPAYAGVKIFNHLPANIKELACDTKNFKKAIKIIYMSIPFTRWTNFSRIKLEYNFDGEIFC
jgi:hypothetical protein